MGELEPFFTANETEWGPNLRLERASLLDDASHCSRGPMSWPTSIWSVSYSQGLPTKLSAT